ncbi:MAG: polysaccharide biosynthesis/export family protein [Nibricoccus sp.]
MSGSTTFLHREQSRRPFSCTVAITTILLLALNTGCGIFRRGDSAPAPVAAPVRESKPAPVATSKAEALTLREGDVVKISFPSAPNLDAVQTIRRDGKISLALIGEVQSRGIHP